MSESQSHCDSIEIGEHRYGVVTHDGKPHVIGWSLHGVPMPLQADIPDGYGVIRSASAELKLLSNSGSAG
jgi:hypothetical protein